MPCNQVHIICVKRPRFESHQQPCFISFITLNILLLFQIGWRGLGKENVNNTRCVCQVFNIIYPMFIMLLLLYTYIYEIVACQWKLDVRKDTQIVTTSTTKIPNITTISTTWPFLTVGPSFIGHRNHSYLNPVTSDACEHIITTYVIPNFLHFIAFMMGLYHFRIQENEQLYALMEKVFLQATPLYNRSASQQNMIHKMRIYLAGGIVWVLMLLGMQALYEWAFDFPRLKFFVIVGPNIHWLLFSIEMLGILILNSVTVAVVANYITQCEMILFYVKGVTVRLQEKSTDLKAAMKDILSVRLNLSLLNGPIARMTGLVSVIFAELAIIGLSILALNKNNLPKVWAYRSLFPFVWSIILVFPLMQAARVNSVCNRFKKIALEIRVFGYKSASQLELDSFLLFISNANLRAKLFHVPILPKYMIAIMVLLLFIILILFQTGIIGSTDLF
ncbi:hypothetical protein CHS0354_021379 [Potamilus streckersoni]|uniref:Uncharacterized protein n=1 Tax=Potamilus streckersoni TaxID=2493646 RepID=A0AAE0S222_9BIVA|nr:hypothetical protein CHS0354_021379 [Potamilus streckersoni]